MGEIGPLREEVSQDLDSRIWGQLSQDLVEVIRTYLPPSTLFRFRCVCRRWSLLHNDPGFVEQYQKSSPAVTSSVLLITHDEDGGRDQVYYLESLSRWFRPQSDFLPKNACVPLASAGGLLCLGSAKESHDLWVCNVLTESCRKLPDMQLGEVCRRGDRPVVNIFVKTRASYDVIVVGDPTLTNLLTVVKIYHSETGCWTQHVEPQLFGRHVPATSVIKNGVVYWFTMTPDGISSYDLNRDTWGHREVRFPQFFVPFGDAHLVVVGGRLGLVGLKAGGAFCTGIWVDENEDEASPAAQWVEELMLTTLAPVTPRDSRLLSFVHDGVVCVANSKTLDWTLCDLRAWVPGAPVPQHNRTTGTQNNWCSYECRWDVLA